MNAMKKYNIIIIILVVAVVFGLGVAGVLAINRAVTIEDSQGNKVQAVSNVLKPTEKPTEKPTVIPTQAPTEPPTEPPLNGFVEVDGVRRYYVDGVVQTETVVGSDKEGYFYVGSDGSVDTGYCNGVSINDTDWIVIEGSAYKVKTKSDKYLFMAARDVCECTDTGMTREEKLKACFDYIKTKYGEGIQHDPAYPPTKSDWYLVYADDIFVKGWGDCYSFGAAYAFMARAIGCTESYACNSTGHGWSEVEGKVYDPEWSMHSKNYSYYAMTYDEPCDVPYKGALAVGKEYKRVQIVINAE